MKYPVFFFKLLQQYMLWGYPGQICTWGHYKASADSRVYLQDPESSIQPRQEVAVCLWNTAGISTDSTAECLQFQNA